MTFFEWVALIRGIVYLWIALTSFSLFQLYKDAYRIADKDSNIIKVLTALLLWIALVFSWFAVSSFTQAFDISAHEIFALLSPIIVLPVGYILTKFRKESITKQGE